MIMIITLEGVDFEDNCCGVSQSATDDTSLQMLFCNAIM